MAGADGGRLLQSVSMSVYNDLHGSIPAGMTGLKWSATDASLHNLRSRSRGILDIALICVLNRRRSKQHSQTHRLCSSESATETQKQTFNLLGRYRSTKIITLDLIAAITP